MLIGTRATIAEFVQSRLNEIPKLSQPYINRLIVEFEGLVDRGMLSKQTPGIERFGLLRRGWFFRTQYFRGPKYQG